MDEYVIAFARSARKELESLPAQIADRVLIKIEALATSPRPRACRKLSGEENLWRKRVGDYRVIYSIDDEHQSIDINAVRHRLDAYR